MAISRQQLVKELEPGLNALFGLEYKQYSQEWTEVFNTESSDRAFEEEVMLSGFANAAVKPEGQGVTFDDAIQELTTNFAWNQVDAENAHMWKDTGLTPDEAQVWVDSKIPNAPHWILSGITDVNVAKKWVNAGFSEGYKWAYNGIKDLNDAKKWKKLGADLDLAYKIKNEARLTSDNLIKSCGTVLGASDFLSGNPYKHVNKCVSTCINVQQILSANQVFAQTGYDPVRMVSATAPNNLTDDFVVNKLACGIYKIQSTEKFELTDGRVVMGNVFKRIGSHKM